MPQYLSGVWTTLLCFLALSEDQCRAQTTCCHQLEAVLGKAVLFPEQAAYNSSLSTYWSQQEQNVTPSCIVSPQNTQDVSKAIKVLSQYQEAGKSIIAGCKFAIRGAGHTPWAGSANIDDGVTIDMTSIGSVDLNRAETVVSVGAGARWSAVYQALDAVGVGVAGGRVADVGVGGLVTGGGLSYHAPRYGFVCDQVVNYEIVLANGTAVNANAKTNSDLWFALKGGSNNFGVVTRFDLKTFPQGKLWGGSIYNPIDTLPAQIQAFVEFNNASNYDINAAMINGYSFTSRISSWTAVNLLVYTKREVNPRVLRPFTDIKPQLGNTMRLTNLSDVTSEQVQNAPGGLRQPTVFQIANTTLQTFAHAPGLVYTLAYEPLPSVITSHGAANAGSPNAFGLDPDAAAQVLALQTVQWAHATDDAIINEAARRIWVQADELAVKMGLQRKWIYLNYAERDQDPIGSYGSENVGKLQAASKKYDPTGLFQTNVPGGFKLFDKVAAESRGPNRQQAVGV
ncbi:MAG: hypothetical protein L6R38_002817 [Xanthoria sp. 2 TBL-2021]|nr:MAG: hypothetical protein L6R38_002817 [Xanthoria sp. 2 TBL-2021]